MQVSKKAINSSLNSKLEQCLIQLLVDTTTPQSASQLLETLLSATERTAVMKRLGIAVLLQEHKSYEEIKSTLNVSSATIAAVQSYMSQPGMQIILEKVKINLLADQWSEKVKKIFSIFNKKLAG